MVKETARERTIQKKFFVDEPENKKIKKIMSQADMTNFSAYARKACLNQKLYHMDFSSLKEIISVIAQANFEVNHIGNNLNQIAKRLNESEQNKTKELLTEYQNELDKLDKKIKKMLKLISGRRAEP